MPTAIEVKATRWEIERGENLLGIDWRTREDPNLTREVSRDFYPQRFCQMDCDANRNPVGQCNSNRIEIGASYRNWRWPKLILISSQFQAADLSELAKSNTIKMTLDSNEETSVSCTLESRMLDYFSFSSFPDCRRSLRLCARRHCRSVRERRGGADRPQLRDDSGKI